MRSLFKTNATCYIIDKLSIKQWLALVCLMGRTLRNVVAPTRKYFLVIDTFSWLGGHQPPSTDETQCACRVASCAHMNLILSY